MGLVGYEFSSCLGVFSDAQDGVGRAFLVSDLDARLDVFSCHAASIHSAALLIIHLSMENRLVAGVVRVLYF